MNTQTYSLPATFADCDIPSTEMFDLLTSAPGWSATSSILPASTIRQIPEPVVATWMGAGLWWAVRRRRPRGGVGAAP